MLSAFLLMSTCGKNHARDFHISARAFEFARNKYAKVCGGENHSHFGKHCSVNTKQKMAKHQPHRKPILQFTLNGDFVKEWSSSKEIERTKPFGTCARQCCHGRYTYAYGYIWKYKEDVENGKKKNI